MKSKSSDKNMSPEEIRDEILRLRHFCGSEAKRELGLKRMRPPDGGGYALEAQWNQMKARKKIKRLEKLVDPAADNKILVDNVKKLLSEGCTIQEISKKLLFDIRNVIKSVDNVIYYENWFKTIKHTAVLAREVLVWFNGKEYVVRYFSMTDLGGHLRPEFSKKFANKSKAINYARKTKRDNQ